MSPRAYRLSKAMRILAEARIGRLVSVENAQEIHDALVRERRVVGLEPIPDVSNPFNCLAPGWIADEMQPKRMPLQGVVKETEAEASAGIHVSIKAARLLAAGVRPPTLMLIAAVREIQSHLRDDLELAEEFKRMQTDVMCNRRHAYWHVESV